MARSSANQSILVTGGAGFIGSAISNLATSDAARWVAVDNLHSQVHQSKNRPKELNERVELVVADITNPLAWEEVLVDVRPSVIIHLAAETGTAQSLHESSRHAEVNVLGTTRMLDALGRLGQTPERIILSSSRAVYGEGRWISSAGKTFQPGQRTHAQLTSRQWDFPDATPLASSALTTIPMPTSIYGATKLAQEHLLSAWCSSHDSDLTILRLQNVYGPGQSLMNPYTGIVSLFSQVAMDGQSIPLFEDGEITRDFVFIDDVARAFMSVLEAPEAGRGPYDIGSGVPTTIGAIARMIAEFHGAPKPHVVGEFRDGDVRFAASDIQATKDGLGWSPRVTVAEGVALLQRWIGNERSLGTSGA